MITIFNDKLQVKISEKGAEVKSVVKNGREYMHEADNYYWNRTSPILFPIVGSVNDNQITVDKKKYNLRQHGFARDKEFEILEEEQNYVSLILNSDSSTQLIYPFQFSLIIDYMLLDDILQVTYKVVNSDEKTMYYQIGGHPAFKINSELFHSVTLQNVVQKFSLEDGKINDIVEDYTSQIEIDDNTFENDALIFNFKKDSEKIATIYEGNNKLIEMNFSELNLLGIWQPFKKEVPFICLEPWNGVADFKVKDSQEFKDKDYINKLDVDQSDIITYTVKFY